MIALLNAFISQVEHGYYRNALETVPMTRVAGPYFYIDVFFREPNELYKGCISFKMLVR